MTERIRDNVYLFPVESPEAEAEPASGADGVDPESVSASDLRAMAACLQYLYRESNRLDAWTTSRLIGAAAMAVADDIRERENSI
jgi:hypothetical protein